MPNTSAMKRGWNYDIANSRLRAMVDGVQAFYIDPDAATTPQYAIMTLGTTPTEEAASQVDGSGVACVGSRTNALEVNADTGSTNLNGDYYISAIKGNFVLGTTSSNASIIGVLGKLNTNTANFGSGGHFAVRGHMNFWGNSTLAGAGNYTGALSAYIENEGTTTVNTGNTLCGIDVYSVGGTVTNSGTHAGIYIRSSASTAAWQYGIYVPIGAGISVSPSEAAIQVGNPTRSAAGQVDGNSFACTASRAAACEIHADTGSTNLNGDYYVSAIYGDFIMGTSASNASIIGVLGKLNTNTAAFNTGLHFAIRGHLNIWGNMTMAGAGNYTGCLDAYLENEGTTTVGSGTWLIGLEVYQVGAPTVSSGGYNPAIYIRADSAGANWQYGIYATGIDSFIYATPTIAGSAHLKAVDINIADATTQSSGYNASFFVEMTTSGTKSPTELGTGRFNHIIGGTYSSGTYYALKAKVGKTGSPTITGANPQGLHISMDEIGSCTSLAAIYAEMYQTTSVTQSFYLWCRSQGDAQINSLIGIWGSNYPTYFLKFQKNTANPSGFFDNGSTAGTECIGHLKLDFDGTAGYINVFSDNS